MVSWEHNVCKDRTIIGRQSRGGSRTLFLCSYFTLSSLPISHSLCWTTIYHSFHSNGCQAARSGCCKDGWEDIIVCVGLCVCVWYSTSQHGVELWGSTDGIRWASSCNDYSLPVYCLKISLPLINSRWKSDAICVSYPVSVNSWQINS